MRDCVFCRIARGEIAVDFLWQEDQVVAFPDANPQAPTHALVIPRRHLPSVAELGPADTDLIGRMIAVAVRVARQAGLDAEDQGFRIVTNTGPRGGQSVPHLHWHVLGGRQLSWPPG